MRSPWLTLCLALSVLALSASTARAQNERGIKETIAYLQKLQTSTGGFLSMEPRPNIRLAPTLRATSSAVRALQTFGGKVPNRDGAAKFVASCFDGETGGFSDFPRGKPDVVSTAIGLIAVAALELPAAKYVEPAIKYLDSHAKTFEDVRIAAAGLEAVKQKAPHAKEWIAQVRKVANADDTGAGAARAAGGAGAALLRLGATLKDRARVLKVMRDGQRDNGGWGKAESEIASDLGSTYRVMRAFAMLKERPRSLEGVRSFVAKCRNEDGGYAVMPGETSTVSGTYYAAMVLHWLSALEKE